MTEITDEKEFEQLNKVRFKEFGELLSISFELNGLISAQCVIAANNLRAVRFFCFILEEYDKLDDKLFKDDEAAH